MNKQSINQITEYWIEKILQGAQRVSLRSLQGMNLPEKIMEQLRIKGREIIDARIELIQKEGDFDLKPPAGEENGLREKLGEILIQRLTLSSSLIREIIQTTYNSILKEWEAEPMSMEQAAELPDAVTEAIFQRASSLLFISAEEEQYDIDIITSICGISGLEAVAEALAVEKKLGV